MRDLRRDDRRGRGMRLGAAAIGAAVAGVGFGTPATAAPPASVTPGSRVFATPGGTVGLLGVKTCVPASVTAKE